MDLTPISYLAERCGREGGTGLAAAWMPGRYGEQLCVAYVDAHCDLNKEVRQPSLGKEDLRR